MQEPNLNFSCGERRMTDLLKMWNARYQIPNYKPFREVTELWLVTEVWVFHMRFSSSCAADKTSWDITLKYSACDWEMKCCSSRCVGLLADYPGDNSTSTVFFYTETFLLRPGMFKDTRLIIQAISKKHLRQPTGGLHRLAFVHLDTLNLLGKEEHGGVDTLVNISWHTGLTLSWLLPYCQHNISQYK